MVMRLARVPLGVRLGRRWASGKASAAAGGLQERLVALCRHRGFVFPGSDIYGGLANSFDYGPLGALMKKHVQDRWWFEFVQKRADCVALDSSVLMNSAGAWGSCLGVVCIIALALCVS